MRKLRPKLTTSGRNIERFSLARRLRFGSTLTSPPPLAEKLASGTSLDSRLAACISGCQFLLKIGATVALWSLGFNCQRSEVVRARLNPKVANESNQEKVMIEANGEEVSGEGGPVPSIAKDTSDPVNQCLLTLPAPMTYSGCESMKNERVHWSR